MRSRVIVASLIALLPVAPVRGVDRFQLLVGRDQDLGAALVLGQLLPIQGDLLGVLAEAIHQVVVGHDIADKRRQALLEGGLVGDEEVGVHQLCRITADR